MRGYIVYVFSESRLRKQSREMRGQTCWMKGYRLLRSVTAAEEYAETKREIDCVD